MADPTDLYSYRCKVCDFSGESRLPGDTHDGEAGACHACGAAVLLEWDGGVTFDAPSVTIDPPL